MPTFPWQTVLHILQILWGEFSAPLKAAALTELKALEVLEKDQPFLVVLIQEAEKLVQAA